MDDLLAQQRTDYTHPLPIRGAQTERNFGLAAPGNEPLLFTVAGHMERLGIARTTIASASNPP
ncbi:MAG: hypothetical protein ACREVR_15035, partial [Burkholderiales bacterium]